jgi:hypothetical protein
MTRKKHPLALAKLKYARHKAQSKFRNIPFLLTFDEWNNWWLSNGVDKNTVAHYSNDKERFCMCRYGDIGAYELSNIYFADATENVSHRNNNKSLPKKAPVLLKIYQWNGEAVDRRQLINIHGVESDQCYRYHQNKYDIMNKEMSLRLAKRHARDVKVLVKWWTAGDQKFRTSKQASAYLNIPESRYKILVKKGQYAKIWAPIVSLDVVEHIRQYSIYPDPYIPENLF